MNVVFFTQNRWAFGNIHHSLSKYLYKKNIYAEVIDFSISYKKDDFALLNEWADVFVTNPDAVQPLMSYDIPYEKIIAVAHARWDIERALNQDPEIFDKVRKYGVVSKQLQDFSKQIGIKRNAIYLPVGIHIDKYKKNRPIGEIKKIGYAGAFSSQNWKGEEIKRGYLALQFVEELKKEGYDVEFVPHNFYIWQSMAAYYNHIDLLVITSTEEGAGLPFMEALASGRYIITTETGYAKEDPFFFDYKIPVTDDKTTLEMMKDSFKKLYNMNKKQKNNMQYENMEIARNYDWRVRGKLWNNMFYDLMFDDIFPED